MALNRSEHWATRAYHRFLESNANTPFKWGENDCALFAANAIEAVTGVDIAGDFRGKYTDGPSALRAIAAIAGGATVADAAAWCAAKHGLVELKHPLLAQRGDLVVLEDDGNLIAGVIHLSGRHIVAAGELGLKRILISDGKTTPIKRAWRV